MPMTMYRADNLRTPAGHGGHRRAHERHSIFPLSRRRTRCGNAGAQEMIFVEVEIVGRNAATPPRADRRRRGTRPTGTLGALCEGIHFRNWRGSGDAFFLG